MIKVLLADNQPVVLFGTSAYLKNNSKIEVVGTVKQYQDVINALKSQQIDVLILDAELDGFTSLKMLQPLLEKHPKTKVLIFTTLAENLYTSSAIKAGASAYVQKNSELEVLESAIIKVHQNEVVFNEDLLKKLTAIQKQNKGDRLHRKLSTREIEVLRYLSAGRKNKEIAEILGLNEKTISTYKLRLLIKLNVTNLLDLVNKAKKLDIF